MSGLRVVGFDPSLRNWGIACGTYDPVSEQLRVAHVDVIQPVLPTGKSVRQNSKDLESTYQLYQKASEIAQQAEVVFVEVPHGSQSARAMASYGMCIGVLGGLRAVGIPFFETTALEVKMATVGKKNASKAEMIEWATTQQPQANWPYYIKNGECRISEAKAEHMADAIGAIVAGIGTTPFKQLVQFLHPRETAATRKTHGNQTQAG